MSSSSQHKNALNQHCLEIIAEIEGKHYVSVEFVLQVLLERYGVTQFEDLFVGTIHDIPALCLLAELQKKTNTFLQAYFSTRSIISYLDLDYEIARMLHSFSLPSMRSLQVSKTVGTPRVVTITTDPNEINLDDDPHLMTDPIGSSSTIPTVSSFTDFGVGPLYLHTLVSLYFPIQQYLQAISNADGYSSNSSSNSSSNEIFDHFITARDVLSCLASVETLPLSLTNNSSSNNNSLSSSAAAVVELFLCEQYEVTNLLEVGIVVSGDMKLEMLMLSHVQAARMKLLAEIQKQQLNDFAQREKDIVASTTTAKRKQQQQQQQHSTESTKPATAQKEGCTLLQLAVCSRTLVAGDDRILSSLSLPLTITLSTSTILTTKRLHRSHTVSNTVHTDFVNKCIARLGDGPYSPSFSKVEDVVRQVVTAQCARTHNSGVHHQIDQRDEITMSTTSTAGKGQRKKRRTQCSDGDGTTAAEGWDQHMEKGQAAASTVGCCRCCPFVVETLTDYVMLHVGSTKYRGKRFNSLSAAAAATAKPSDVDEVPVGGIDIDASTTAAGPSFVSPATATATATAIAADASTVESMVLNNLDHGDGDGDGHTPVVTTEVTHEARLDVPVPVNTVATASSSSSQQNHNDTLHHNDGSLGGGMTQQQQQQQQQPLFECKLFRSAIPNSVSCLNAKYAINVDPSRLSLPTIMLTKCAAKTTTTTITAVAVAAVGCGSSLLAN